GQASDRYEQPQGDPVPGAQAVSESACAEERARKRRREDQRRRPGMQALDGGLLLKQPAQGFLEDEGRAGVILERGRCRRRCPLRCSTCSAYLRFDTRLCSCTTSVARYSPRDE